ncbi:MAG: 50S ribosomal protein L18 [Nanoarchaeota archaeon]
MEYKRKIQNRTNYRKRLMLLKSENIRLVIRRSLRGVCAQLVQYYPEGDKTLVSANSRELIKLGYKAPRRNIPTAYLVGALIAKKSKEKSIIKAVADIGFYAPIHGSVILSVIKGAKDGGLNIAIGDEAAPKQERIEGKHIANYYEKEKGRFSKYQIDPAELPNMFKEVKKKLIGNG